MQEKKGQSSKKKGSKKKPKGFPKHVRIKTSSRAE